jgi:Ca2+-binding RTX toxin-like protein
MSVRSVVAAGASILALALPSVAAAGTVTLSGGTITYQADPATGADESVDVAVDISGMAFVTSNAAPITASNCGGGPFPSMSVECGAFAGTFVVNLLGFNDSLGADVRAGPAAVEAHGGAGDDRLSGTQSADRLFGEEGGDNLDGKGGNDTLDGGPGENYYDDGAGDDTITGGPGNDTLTSGPGRDSFSGGDGNDSVDYRARTAGVTITLDGQPDDGEAGEGDNIGADIEDVSGGSGNDRIVAGAQPTGTRLHGGPGNDTITGSPQEDRVEGEEGDDTIDTRDGRYDSVDCGPGNDTLLADPGDGASNCEVAPDRDGDGTLNEADCQPDNPAVHPGAGEIVGNDVDEDCKDGPGYLRVEAGLSFDYEKRKSPPRIRFTTLRVSDLKARDRIELRCRGKGCAFRRKVLTARPGKPRTSLVGRFKRRFLRRGAVVEIRILRAHFEGKVFRLRVAAGPSVKRTRLCLKPGETQPKTCR